MPVARKVWQEMRSLRPAGVFGQGAENGVLGSTSGLNYAGVEGDNTSSVNGYGVLGISSNGTGVYGSGTSSSSGYGVGVEGVGYIYGVYGVNNYGNPGVYGTSTGGTGNGQGVYGYATGTNSAGVYGQAAKAGVWGYGGTYGVWGQGGYTGGYGVYGTAPTSGGYAGYFDGDVHVTGTLSAQTVLQNGAKPFVIDHPLDPSNRVLRHASIESNEVKNLYDGIVTTDREGNATVVLPKYFESLNENYRYQLTVIGSFARAIISSEIEAGQFSIKTDKPSTKVSWQVTGIRHDAFIKAHPLRVEEDKTESERGKFYAAVEMGYPEERGIYYSNPPKKPLSPAHE